MKKSKLIPLALLFVLMVAVIAVIVITLTGTKKTVAGSGRWTILASEGTKDAAKTLQASIKSTGVVKSDVVTTVPKTWDGRLILVGETTEEASKVATLTLKEDEFLVKFDKEFIIITGGSDEATTEAVNYVCEKYTTYLEENHDFPFGTEYDYFAFSKNVTGKTKQLLVNGVSFHRYQIVAEQGAKNEAATFLQTAIKNMTGTEMKIVEKQAEDDYGIIIQSGKNGAATDLKGQQFRIYQDGKKFYLCAANPEQEMLVVKMLLTKYMEYEYEGKQSKESMVKVEVEDFKFTCNWDEFTAPKIVQSKILGIPEKDQYDVMQGGCSIGKYGYFIMNNQVNHPYVNRIYKVDLETYEIVQVSETVECQHANSLMYNSKLGKLICVNYEPDTQILSYIDPETLKVTGTEEVDFHALSITYNEEKDEYIAGTQGAFDFFKLDKNFAVIDYHEAIQTTAVKQEVEVYKDKVLFSMSGDSVAFVYNWDGEYLYTIDLEREEEIENIIFYKDVAFTGYNVNTKGTDDIYEAIFYQEIK